MPILETNKQTYTRLFCPSAYQKIWKHTCSFAWVWNWSLTL